MQYIFILLILSLPVRSLSQKTSYLPTTQEEYNYVTKGYQVQITNGLDMKKGYELGRMFSRTIGNYEFTARALLRKSTNQVAGIMMQISSKVSNKTYFLCIPYENLELMNKYLAEVKAFDWNLSNAYAQLMSTYAANYAFQMFEMEKQRKK